MSSGELSQLLTQGRDQFHAEKEELLATGIRCSSYIQTDDTGTRHKGQNGYCTIIDNESFAWFESTGSKSRENFVSLLYRPWPTYSLTEDALAYLEKHDYPQKWLRVLKPCRGVTFLSHEAWVACMKDLGITGKRRREANEAMIYGSLIQHGAGHLTTFSDGARQFDIFKHSQCWIHAERGLAGIEGPEPAAAQQPEREPDPGICEARKDQWWNAKRCRVAMSRHLCQPEENVSPVWSFIPGLSDRQANRRRGVPEVGGFD